MPRMRRSPLAFFALVVFFWAPAAAHAANTQTVLDGLRKAMLERSIGSITSIHTVGNIEVLGLHGRVQEWADVRGSRFTTAQTAAALSGAAGWDGKTAWNQDYSGLVTIDGGAAGRLQAIDQAYLDNLRYLRPDAGGATIVYAGRRQQGGKPYDVLAVSPPQGAEVDLWVDPETRLIARETATIGLVTFTTTLSSYRHIDGVYYPLSTVLQTSEGNSSTVRVSSLELNTDVAERMRVPGSSVHDASIAGHPSTTVPLQIVNNHIYVNVMVNGRGPYTFVMDTGGDYILTPEVAQALQAKSSGGLQLGGVGNATEGASFAHVDSIQAGDAVVRNQYCLVLPIATGFGMAEGMRVDGMVGYQFLARFLTTIDYADSKLTLAMPPSAPATAAGAAIPFYFDNTIPRIPITVDNVTTSGEIDTGSRVGVTLSTPFVAAHPAIAALAKTPPVVEGFGVGGPSYARLGRIPALQIGPYTIPNTIGSFATQSQGAMADPFNPANVGGAILRRFDLTLDYAHHQLLFAKNASFDAPAAFDRSGMFLIVKDGAYTVISVLPGSAAASGGLAQGDVIVTVNGSAASSQSLAALRALLSGPAGTTVKLHVRNASGERDVKLTLADYV